MNRRDFVRTLPVLPTGLAMGAGVLSLSACGGLTYLAPTGDPGRLRIPVAALPAAGALLQRPDLPQPIFVRADEDGAFVALLLRCTHRGCTPDPVGDRLVCPCHGSEFDGAGNVLEGPAESPLTRYRTEVDGDEIVVLVGGVR